MKKRIVFFACMILCGLLIAFHQEAAEAARQGFLLWRDSVLPALLPFFVCTALMQRVGALRPDEPAALFALAFLSGAPSGARLCGQLRAEGDSSDLTYAAASLNALSPVFVCGAFASGMLHAPSTAIALITAQLLAMLACFAIAWKELPPKGRHSVPSEDSTPVAILFVGCIRDAVFSLLSICGTIVFFSVLVQMLKITGLLFLLSYPLRFFIVLLGGEGVSAEAIFASLLEVASGSSLLAQCGLSLRLTVTVSAFSFSFCGLCIAAQSMLFYPVRLGKYLIVKLVQGTVSAIVAYLLFPLCFRGAESVSALPEQGEFLANTLSAGVVFAVSLASMGVVMLLCLAKRKKANRTDG